MRSKTTVLKLVVVSAAIALPAVAFVAPPTENRAAQADSAGCEPAAGTSLPRKLVAGPGNDDYSSMAPLCPPYGRLVVFLTPHPDDETIGMGGAILEAKRAGHTVIVEVLTQGGSASYCRQDLAARHWDFNVPDGVGHPCRVARVKETIHALQLLGADGIVVNDWSDGSLTPANVAQRISHWRSQHSAANPVALRGTVGGEKASDGRAHEDHAAVWTALLSELRQPDGIKDIKGYFVYLFSSWGTGFEPADYRVHWIPGDLCRKKYLALEAFKPPVDEPHGRYAIGWFSASAEIRGAQAHCREYWRSPAEL